MGSYCSTICRTSVFSFLVDTFSKEWQFVIKQERQVLIEVGMYIHTGDNCFWIAEGGHLLTFYKVNCLWHHTNLFFYAIILLQSGNGRLNLTKKYIEWRNRLGCGTELFILNAYANVICPWIMKKISFWGYISGTLGNCIISFTDIYKKDTWKVIKELQLRHSKLCKLYIIETS